MLMRPINMPGKPDQRGFQYLCAFKHLIMNKSLSILSLIISILLAIDVTAQNIFIGSQGFTTGTYVIPSCNSAIEGTHNNGSLQVTTVNPGNGATGPFTLEWSGGNISGTRTGNTVTGLIGSTYQLTIIDQPTGDIYQEFIVLPSRDPLGISFAKRAPTCYGASNGWIRAYPIGGSYPYSYLWSNGQTTRTATNLAGMPAIHSFSVTITDTLGCSRTFTTNLRQPQPVAANITSSNPSCGACDGSASSAPTGGTGTFAGNSTAASPSGYTYLWTPGGYATSSISNLCPGTYSVTVTDDSLCSATSTVTLSNISSLAASISLDSPVNCAGGTSGSLSVTVSGGTPSYTYLWSQGGTAQSISGLAAGTYSVVVTDASGCTTSASYTITEPPALAITTSVSDANCNCDGSASVAVSGGAPNYSLQWSNGSNSLTANGLCAGAYSVIAIDANGCRDTVSVTVNKVTAFAMSAGADAALCDGDSIQLQGIAPASAVWTFWYPFETLSDSLITNPIATPTVTTTYYFSVSDTNNCIETDSVVIYVNPPIVLTATVTQPSCNSADGSISLAASGGAGVFTYLWMPGGNISANISNLGAGYYTVDVRDNLNCEASLAFTLTDTCGYIWPGDANDNGIANNFDILYIGQAAGAAGPSRVNASSAWVPQVTNDWPTTFADGLNHKYADCNGDGSIDHDDASVVGQNYGLTHANRIGLPHTAASDPELYLNTITDTIAPGAQAQIMIGLGTASQPAAFVYGLAFTISFDPSLADSASFTLDASSSWMGTDGVDLLAIHFTKYASQGMIDVAITRMDGNNISGAGSIGMLTFTSGSSLAGTGNSSTFYLNITNPKLILNDGTEMTATINGDTVIISDPAIVGLGTLNESISVSVSPNPFSEEAVITVNGNTNTEHTIEVMNLLGEKVYTAISQNGKFTIKREGLASGAYLYRIISKDGRQASGRLIAE